MRGRSKNTLIGLYLCVPAVLVLAGCAAKSAKPRLIVTIEQRQSPTEPSTTDLQPSAAPVAEVSPRYPSSKEDLIVLILRDARLLATRGKELFQEGEQEDAKGLFQESLDTLKNSGLDFYEYPALERTYYELLSDFQNMEVQALVDVSELQQHLEPTPLEEIAEVNLFTIEIDPELEEMVSEDLRKTHFDIPMVLNESVLKFLNYYQGRGRRIMEDGLRRSGRYMPVFREIFQAEGVPLDLIYMAHVESLFKPRAYSRAKARGIWQFIQATGERYDLRVDWWTDERSDVAKSTLAAARHLKDLYDQFQDWSLALAAYNVGAGRIERNLERHGSMDYWAMADKRLIPRETVNYVPSILAAIIIFRHPERYGFEIEPDPPVEFTTLPIDFQVDLRVVADSLNVPSSTIIELNPELRRGVTPYGVKRHLLKVPMGIAELAAQRLKELPAEERLRVQHHRVGKGETLSVIARKYGSSIQSIAEMNKIRNVNRLVVGQDLLIPSGATQSAGNFKASAPATRSSRHTVRRGDSLYKIARLYGVSVDDLSRWNKLRPGQAIYPGQRLAIKGSARSLRTAGGQNDQGNDGQ